MWGPDTGDQAGGGGQKRGGGGRLQTGVLVRSEGPGENPARTQVLATGRPGLEPRAGKMREGCLGRSPQRPPETGFRVSAGGSM